MKAGVLNMGGSKNRKLTLRRSTLIANGALLLLIIISAVHFKEGAFLLMTLSHLQWQWIVLIILLQCGTYFCTGGVWEVVLAQFTQKTSLRAIAALSVEKLFIDQVLPTLGMGGSLAVMQSLVSRDVKRGDVMAVFIIDEFSYFGAYLCLFALAVGALWYEKSFSGIILYLTISFTLILVCIICALLFILRAARRDELPRWVERFGFTREFAHMLREAPHRILMKKKLWAITTGLQALLFALDAATLWAIFRALNVTLSPLQALESFMLASAVATLSVVPGGLGFFDTAGVEVLHLFGVSFELGVTGILLYRLCTYWLPMIPGFLIFRSELKRTLSA